MRKYERTWYEWVNVLGVNVAKAKLDCALRLPDGKFKNKVIGNTLKGFRTLTERLGKHDATTAHAWEATGVHREAAAEFLAGKGVAASVVNPARSRRLAGRIRRAAKRTR